MYPLHSIYHKKCYFLPNLNKKYKKYYHIYKTKNIVVLDLYIKFNFQFEFFLNKFFIIHKLNSFRYYNYTILMKKLINHPFKTYINVPYDIFRIYRNLPTMWSVQDRWNWLEKKKRIDWGDIEISFDNLKVFYRGMGKTDEDAAAIRSNATVSGKLGIFYYEVKIINSGRDGFIGIGLCSEDVDLDRLPGWEIDSIGYHGDDGNVFKDSGIGIPYGPKYTNGDIIGVCWNLLKQSVFFTKNGYAMQEIFFKISSPNNKRMMPVVGLRTPGEIVEVNFCIAKFEFDLNFYINNEIYILLNKIVKIGKSSHSQSLTKKFPVKNKKLFNFKMFQYLSSLFLKLWDIISFLFLIMKKKIIEVFRRILNFENFLNINNIKQTTYWINYKWFRIRKKFSFLYLIKLYIKNELTWKKHIFQKNYSIEVKIKPINQWLSNLSIFLHLNYHIPKYVYNFEFFTKYIIFYIFKVLMLKKAKFQNDLFEIFSIVIKKGNIHWKELFSMLLKKIFKLQKNNSSDLYNFLVDKLLFDFSMVLFFLNFNLHVYSLVNLSDFQYNFAIFNMSIWI